MWMLERYYDELTQGHPDRTQITPVNITAAAEWFFVGTPKDNWDTRDDFPVTIPPFPEMWIEFIPPKYINVDGERERWPIQIQSAGCAASCIKVPPEESTNVIRDNFIHKAFIAGGIVDNNPPGAIADGIKRALEHGREAAWVAHWDVSFEYEHRLRRGPSFTAYIEPDGRIVTELALLSGPREFMAVHPIQSFWPFWFATSLMHAKNVSVADDPLPDAIRRRRVKDGKPVITFRTLKIAPMRKQAKREAEECQQSEAKRAMHIVRGHFKDYRESGLFGKNKGLYWWDMHVAGDESAGRVIKDYKL